MKSHWIVILVLFLSLALTACGSSDDIVPDQVNSAPTANAGGNQTVLPSNLVKLDAIASTDPEDDDLTCIWTFVAQPDGSNATLTDAATATPTFTPDLNGAYVLALVVNDGLLDSEPDYTSVVSNPLAPGNTAPTANAGGDQTVLPSDLVMLNAATSSDPEGNGLTYSWIFVAQPDGSIATLSDAAAAAPTFTPDLDGAYVLALVVNDGLIDSAADFVTINSPSVTNLSGADLSWANLSGFDLSWVDLSRANLFEANLFEADLSGANLSGANLSGANLSWADLTGADLTGADLTGADLTGADLTGADLTGSNWFDSICPDGTNSDANMNTCEGHLN